MDKENFKISELKAALESRHCNFPKNNDEFKEIFIDRETKFPAMPITEKLISIGIDKEELYNDYPTKEQKIDLFFEKFNVIYDLGSSVTNDSTREIENNNKQSQGENLVNNVQSESADKHIFTLNEAKEIFEKIKLFIVKNEDINSSEGKFIYKSNVTVHNELLIKHKNISICNNFSLITDAQNSEVCAVGQIISEELDGRKKDYFIASKKCVDYDKFSGKTKFNIVMVDTCHNEIFENYTGTNVFENMADMKIYFNEVKIKTEAAKYSENELCIDFGTSNTTVGSYDTSEDAKYALEPKIVKFMNVNDNNKLVNICPTVVYIKNCANKNAVEYLFGYEALKTVIKNDYDTKASVFYEIKKWVNAHDNDSTVTIEDEYGNEINEMPKQDIVKAYLDFIIERAEEYFGYKFKKLHFSAPTRMKSKFINALTKMYEGTDYGVCPENESIDEALSIVYDHIYENEAISENEEKRVVVLDCGGGTTDLATCSYKYSETPDGYKRIDISTQFENGNTSFGGNTITFKIMQLLKIKIALINGMVAKEKYDEIFSKSEEDILSSVDEIQLSKEESAKVDFDSIEVYRKFNKLYEECENYIPTIFVDNKDFQTTKDRSCIKRNFYYLWQFAEKIKLAFYQFDNVMVEGNKLDESIDFSKIEKKEYLYYCSSEEKELLELKSPFDKIKISINDIRKIICGNIYILLEQVLPDEPEKYDYYRLSGQSCKINLFNELLKEFIPGKKIREKICNKAKESNEELKLKCIKGSIHYKTSTKHGLCEVKTSTKPPKIIYKVMYMDDEGTLAFSQNRDSAVMFNFTSEQKNLRLEIKDMNDRSINRIDFKIKDDSDYKEKSIADIDEKLSRETSATLDAIAEVMRKIGNVEAEGADTLSNKKLGLVLPSKDGYGFLVYNIMIHFSPEITTYKITDGEYYDYEKEDKGFFDGRR